MSTYKAKGPGGGVVELPTLRADVGVPPPCEVCPKTAGRAKEPLPPADDLFGQDWFWDAREWAAECRHLGFPPGLPPLMRAVAKEYLDAAERDRDRRTAGALAAGLADAITKRR